MKIKRNSLAYGKNKGRAELNNKFDTYILNRNLE